MQIDDKTKLEAASRIMQGLLASGHFTGTDEEGEPEVKYWMHSKELAEELGKEVHCCQYHAIDCTMLMLRILIRKIEEEKAPKS